MSGYSALRPLSVWHARALGGCGRSWRNSVAPVGTACWSGSSLRVAAQQAFFSSSSSKPPEPPPTPGALLEGAVQQLLQPHIDEAERQVLRLREELQAQAAAFDAASKKEESRDLSEALTPHLEKATEQLRQEMLAQIGSRFDETQRTIEQKGSEILSRKKLEKAEAEQRLDAAVESLTAELRTKPDLKELNAIVAAELEQAISPMKEELIVRVQSLDAVTSQVRALEEQSGNPEAIKAQVIEAVARASGELQSQVKELEAKVRCTELGSDLEAQVLKASEMEARIRQDMAGMLAAADVSKALEAQLCDNTSALAKAFAARLTSDTAQELINAKVEAALAPLKEELRAKLSAQEAKALVAEQVQEALAPLQAELSKKLNADDVKALVAGQPADPADVKTLVAEQVEASLKTYLDEQRSRPTPEVVKPHTEEAPQEKQPNSPLGSLMNFLMQLLGVGAVLLVVLAGAASLPAKPKSPAAPRTAPVVQEGK